MIINYKWKVFFGVKMDYTKEPISQDSAGRPISIRDEHGVSIYFMLTDLK